MPHVSRGGRSGLGRVALTAVAVAVLLRLVGPLRRRAALIREVAPDLRSPLLLVPTDLSSARRLELARRWVVRPTKVGERVAVAERRVPGPTDGPDVRVLVYDPDDRARPSGALVWVHGGGMVMGRPEAAHEWCSKVATALGVLVISVDYRLAPEHPFPAGLDDVVAALAWVHDEAEVLGIRTDRVVIGGDSAGGGLAASTAQVARHRGLPIARQVLVYPMLDDRTSGRGPTGTSEALLWTARSNRFAWNAYCGDAPRPTATGEHPAPGRTADVRGVAPAWIGVGDIDLFHDEDQAYAQRLRSAGVACEVHVARGLFHGADAVFPERPTARAFHLEVATAIAVGACGDDHP